MQTIPDSFLTLGASSTGEFKDRGSKFFAYAYPVCDEEEALLRIEALQKEHFKARHHCYAWRFGMEGLRFRANDDGEPSGTAGRPILGQIDSLGLTDVCVVVVRYFGGTLLGASGLIHAYREAAADALRRAEVVEVVVKDRIVLEFAYAVLPDLMNSVKKLGLEIYREAYDETSGQMVVGIRKSRSPEVLLSLKAMLRKTSPEEAATLEWPDGLTVEFEAI